MTSTEHEIINEWARAKAIVIEDNVQESLVKYANLVHEANNKFNITGFKTTADILRSLAIGSIDPLCDISVPRGTNFVDIGSGAGAPGIILGIFFRNISGLLVEANHKKANFIDNAIRELALENLKVVRDRVENIAREEHRESFDWCFARAFGSAYITMELGAPFVKLNGKLYIYSKGSGEDLPAEVLNHADGLGLSVVQREDRSALGIAKEGILFSKKRTTPKRFPRRFSVIKRDAKRIGEDLSE